MSDPIFAEFLYFFDRLTKIAPPPTSSSPSSQSSPLTTPPPPSSSSKETATTVPPPSSSSKKTATTAPPPLSSSSSTKNAKTAPLSILAAVSGGADSVAMVHILSEYREKLGIGRIGVAHVNHGLRGEESDGDEAFVRNIADDLGVEFFCERLHGLRMDDAGIEEAAREHRYNFFAQIIAEHGFDFAATAHTANDQAETVIMRMIRGAGVRGLRGIHPVRADKVIRPLLNVERADLETYLRERGITYRADSSNADDKFRRNFVRNKIMPLLIEANAGAARNIASAADSAAAAWEVVSAAVGKWAREFVVRINDDAFHIEKAGFAVAAPDKIVSDKIVSDKNIADKENRSDKNITGKKNCSDNNITNNNVDKNVSDAVVSEALAVLFDDYGIKADRHHITRVTSCVEKSSGKYLLPNGWTFYPREDRLCFVRE